jgi:hypothetical protein
MIYLDALVGFPVRGLGWVSKKAGGKQVSEVLGLAGGLIGNIRKVVETVDTFVGRYLVFSTSVYIVFKFVHFKFFNIF